MVNEVYTQRCPNSGVHHSKRARLKALSFRGRGGGGPYSQRSKLAAQSVWLSADICPTPSSLRTDHFTSEWPRNQTTPKKKTRQMDHQHHLSLCGTHKSADECIFICISGGMGRSSSLSTLFSSCLQRRGVAFAPNFRCQKCIRGKMCTLVGRKNN